MNILSIVIILLAIILLLPIPISIKFIYKDKKVQLYLFGIKVNLSKIINIIKKRKDKKKPAPPKKLDIDSQDVMFLINKIDCLKFKSRLRLSYSVGFGLGDAYYTALTFGYVHTVLPFFYKLLSIPFSLRVSKAEIKPHFESLHFSIMLKSIIFINIAQIIYIAVVIFKSLKYIKKRKK